MSPGRCPNSTAKQFQAPVLPCLLEVLVRVGCLLTAAALIALPFQGWAGRPWLVFGKLPFDWLIAFAFLFSLPRLTQDVRRGLSRPATGGCLALVGAGLWSELMQSSQAQLPLRLAEQVAPLVVVWVLSLHARRQDSRQLLLWCAVVGGALSVSIGLGGWAWDIAMGGSLSSDRSAHPVFDKFPRFLGTVASSPQRAGNLLVFLLASLLALPRAEPRIGLLVRRVVGAMGGVGLVLTTSFAWAGGAVLLAGVWLGRSSRLRRRRRGWLALCALAIGVAIASYPLSVGVVADRRSGSCQQLDAAHYVVTIDPITHACTRLSRGGRTITTYTQAKRLAWRAFIQHPWIGVGFRGFAQYAVQQFEQVHQAPGSYYRQPHGIYHGLPAKHGVAGLLAWLLIVGALIRGWRGRAWDWCVAALLVIGLHLDVDRLREFWVAWGLLAAEQWGNAKPWWRSKQTAVR